MATRSDFDAYHAANPHLYAVFCRFTLEVIKAGRKASVGMIFNRIRWETRVVTEGDRFKINDRYQPFYSRKFMEDHPQHRGFFSTRRCRTSEADDGTN